MSEKQLKAFLEKANGDASLQERLKAADNSDAVIAIAREVGFVIAADDLQQAQLVLSEEDLEELAGGTFATTGWVLTVVVK